MGTTTERITADEAVRRLDDIKAGFDVENAHIEADAVLLACVPQEVADAYSRVEDRTGCGFWYA